LVLEFIRGRRLGDLDEAERARVRARLLRAFARQVLDHGVFHADPHPGNVLVDDEGRVVLLDLGAVDAIDADLRRGLARLFRAVSLGRRRALADAVLAISPDGATVAIDRARLEADLEHVTEELGEGAGAEVLGSMIAIGRTHRLRMAPALVALVRALALLDGVLRNLDPARDLLHDLRREVMLSFGRRMARTVGRAPRALLRLPAQASALLERLVTRLRRLAARPAAREPLALLEAKDFFGGDSSVS
jgi:ubiquinone biosynthesis protein